MQKNYKIAITTGDKFGIGKELVLKALNILKPKKEDVLIIGEKIDCNYDFLPIEIQDNGTFCFESLKTACRLAKKGEIKGLVTAPVSKFELNKSGFNFNGQTEVIQSFLDGTNKKAQMLFIANNLRVMLLTRHIPLKEINLKIEDIVFQTKILNDFLIEKCKIQNPKIALCALNPHAGENGILGSEEIEILNPASTLLNKQGINITKATSADALFSKIGFEYLNKQKLSYDAVIATYHDQGLCPIKALAFDKAVNTTIGLPVTRTSPTSGTAYDIAGKNIANPASMVEAIKLALKLA